MTRDEVMSQLGFVYQSKLTPEARSALHECIEQIRKVYDELEQVRYDKQTVQIQRDIYEQAYLAECGKGDACPTCKSDKRDVRGEGYGGFDRDGSHSEGRLVEYDCQDEWHDQ